MQGLGLVDVSEASGLNDEEPTTSRYRVRTLARLSFISRVLALVGNQRSFARITAPQFCPKGSGLFAATKLDFS